MGEPESVSASKVRKPSIGEQKESMLFQSVYVKRKG
jgi:hypothetical protein